MNTNRYKYSASLRLCVSLPLFLLLVACAESEPYKRLVTGPTQEIATEKLVKAYDDRWPQQFKSVQTVTIDFGPVTKTFNALLIVQRPGRFRLQGMTEQGIKIFEVAHNESGDHVLFRADEISDQTIASISRDIQRVFLQGLTGIPESSRDQAFHYLEGNSAELTSRVLLLGGRGSMDGRPSTWPEIPLEWMEITSRDAWVDRFEQIDRTGRLYCYAYFEWQHPQPKIEAEKWLFFPHVIVLRDSGRESKSYPYKLTIKITELTVRDTPWPEKTFKP